MEYQDEDMDVQEDGPAEPVIAGLRHIGIGMVRQSYYKDPSKMTLEDFINESKKESNDV